jgi:predicted metal-dependent peptidase
MFNLKLSHKETYAYYYDKIKGRKIDGAQSPQNDGSDQSQNENSQQNNTGANGEGDKSQGQNGGVVGQETDSEGSQETEVVTANSGKELKDHDWQAGDDQDEANAIVRELMNSAFDMMSDESRGLMPAEFLSQVEKINAPPKLSWQAILKKYIGTVSSNKRKTKMRLNRRQPDRFDLSGRVDDKILKIAVAIDTSASVDDQMIASIFGEIFEILAKRKHEITVIECDAKVQRVYKARNKEEVKMKIVGRGGTLFTPVIEYVNNDKYYRDALLIYFTDGFGEMSIPRPKTSPKRMAKGALRRTAESIPLKSEKVVCPAPLRSPLTLKTIGTIM